MQLVSYSLQAETSADAASEQTPNFWHLAGLAPAAGNQPQFPSVPIMQEACTAVLAQLVIAIHFFPLVVH